MKPLKGVGWGCALWLLSQRQPGSRRLVQCVPGVLCLVRRPAGRQQLCTGPVRQPVSAHLHHALRAAVLLSAGDMLPDQVLLRAGHHVPDQLLLRACDDLSV